MGSGFGFPNASLPWQMHHTMASEAGISLDANPGQEFWGWPYNTSCGVWMGISKVAIQA